MIGLRRAHPRPRTLSRYVDGELSGGALRRVEAHVFVCEGCRRLLASLRRTVQELRTLPPPSRAGQTEQIIAVVRSAGRPPTPARRTRLKAAVSYCLQGPRLRITVPVALAAGVLLILVNQGGHLLAGDISLGMCAMCATNILLPFVALNLLLSLTASRIDRRQL